MNAASGWPAGNSSLPAAHPLLDTMTNPCQLTSLDDIAVTVARVLGVKVPDAEKVLIETVELCAEQPEVQALANNLIDKRRAAMATEA